MTVKVEFALMTGLNVSSTDVKADREAAVALYQGWLDGEGDNCLTITGPSNTLVVNRNFVQTILVTDEPKSF